MLLLIEIILFSFYLLTLLVISNLLPRSEIPLNRDRRDETGMSCRGVDVEAEAYRGNSVAQPLALRKNSTTTNDKWRAKCGHKFQENESNKIGKNIIKNLD